MTHEEKRIYLIKWLLNENDEYRGTEIPDDEYNQKRLLRGLMNVRMPGDAAPEFLKIQDEYLQEALAERGVVDVAELPEIEPGICLWQGDITRLNADAIANAANVGCSKLIPLRVTATFKKSRNYGTLSWFSIMEKAA